MSNRHHKKPPIWTHLADLASLSGIQDFLDFGKLQTLVHAGRQFHQFDLDGYLPFTVVLEDRPRQFGRALAYLVGQTLLPFVQERQVGFRLDDAVHDDLLRFWRLCLLLGPRDLHALHVVDALFRRRHHRLVQRGHSLKRERDESGDDDVTREYSRRSIPDYFYTLITRAGCSRPVLSVTSLTCS